MHAADFRILPTELVSEKNKVNGAAYTVGSTLVSGTTSSQFSGVVDAGKCVVRNITTPSSLLGVATLRIFHSDQPDGTFTVLKQLNSATDYTITLTASSTIPLDTILTAGLGYIKFAPNATVTGGDLVIKIGVKQEA